MRANPSSDKLKQIIPRLVTIASARNVNRSTDPEYLWKREKVLMVHAHASIVSERVRLDELEKIRAKIDRRLSLPASRRGGS